MDRYSVVRCNGHFGVYDAFRKQVTKEGDSRFCTVEAKRLNDERRPPTPSEVRARNEARIQEMNRRCTVCNKVYECRCPGGKQ